LRVDGVAQAHLNVVQHLEHGRRDLHVPDVERDCESVIAIGLGEVGPEPSLGDPSSGLRGLHDGFVEGG